MLQKKIKMQLWTWRSEISDAWCILVYLSVKGQMAIFEEMIEDEEGLVDDRLPTTSRGLWAASETERALKAILSFAKAHRLDAKLTEEGNTFLELFEAWKKEYKVLHCGCEF